MLKQNKGITMISLVVTVIVLMILASITTYSGISTAKESRYYNAVHQMKVMQSEKIKKLVTKQSGIKDYFYHLVEKKHNVLQRIIQLKIII